MTGVDVIIAALARGAAAEDRDPTDNTIGEAIATLRVALRHRLGSRLRDPRSLNIAEPREEVWHDLLSEDLVATGAAADQTVLAAARGVLDLINSIPDTASAPRRDRQVKGTDGPAHTDSDPTGSFAELRGPRVDQRQRARPDNPPTAPYQSRPETRSPLRDTPTVARTTYVGSNSGVVAESIDGPVRIANRTAPGPPSGTGRSSAPAAPGIAHADQAVNVNHGLVATFNAPVSIRLGNALGSIFLALGLAGTAGLVVWLLIAGRTIGWSSLPSFAFTIEPSIWTMLVPVAILIYRAVRNATAQAGSPRQLASAVLDDSLGLPAFFGLLVWQSDNRLHGHHWWDNAFFRGVVNSVNAFLQTNLRHNGHTFTSAYLSLVLIGLILGLIQSGTRLLLLSGHSQTLGHQAGAHHS